MIPASLEHCDYVQGMAVCNSYFGLLIIGFGITFSTFLAKTYRINKIMNSAKRFRRVKISTRDTIYPVAIVYSCTLERNFRIFLLTMNGKGSSNRFAFLFQLT